MPDYAAQINVEDRWAIVAYIRALQLSEHATVADVPRRSARADAAMTLTQTADELMPELAALSAATADRGCRRAAACRSSAGSSTPRSSTSRI